MGWGRGHNLTSERSTDQPTDRPRLSSWLELRQLPFVYLKELELIAVLNLGLVPRFLRMDEVGLSRQYVAHPSSFSLRVRSCIRVGG